MIVRMDKLMVNWLRCHYDDNPIENNEIRSNETSKHELIAIVIGIHDEVILFLQDVIFLPSFVN